MSNPSSDELQESIKELIAYRERLKKEVINIGQKLKMPKGKIESSIQKHEELTLITQALEKLQAQLKA